MPETASPPLHPGTPIEALPGMSRARAARFARLGVETVTDLLRHLPARYEREAAESPVAALVDAHLGSVRGTIVTARWVPRAFGRKGRFEATLADDSGALNLVWFNAAYLRDKLHPGMTIRVQGKMQQYNHAPQMVNPRWERLDDQPEREPAQDERLRPIYPATEGLTSDAIERVVDSVLPQVLSQVHDPVSRELLAERAMPPLADAFRMAHRPDTREEGAAARRRLAYNELLLLQLGIALKRAWVRDRLEAPALPRDDEVDARIRARFPFELTGAQNRAVEQIAADLAATRPMNRLLQGDVGSGKTVVALYALMLAVANGRQAALMAPTELLAEQHFSTIDLMLRDSDVRIALLTAANPGAAPAIGSGAVDIAIGTHALLGERVRFRDLAVVVIDEQHRFGVMQRATFRRSDDASPHVPHHLVMTATPIPRTLSLTVFGDLDVSTIDELPPGRTPIACRVVEPDDAEQVYRYLGERLERGEQAYVVVPTIDPRREDGAETATGLKNVREHARKLEEVLGPDRRVATVHGRLKRLTRERVMDRFRRGLIDVLVATTVIEVGVDVPNATVMIIEHAERFGLAQLHQLRGRVGRGADGRKSLCVFIAEPTTDEAARRLEAIASTSDGFRVAELDLEIRGMGDFFGTRQSGLPPLRVAQIPGDMELLLAARRDAAALIERDPLLRGESNGILRQILLQQYGEALGLIDVG